ncbi:MAG: hypothetical protein ACFE9S_18980 [Candidatus Hermodarchaeota archaeon]
MEKLCYYCGKRIPDNKWVCASCQFFISLAEAEGLKLRPKFLKSLLSLDRVCGYCGYKFNYEIIELLKLNKKKRLKADQIRTLYSIFCPMCRSFSKFLECFYDLIIYENLNFINCTNWRWRIL